MKYHFITNVIHFTINPMCSKAIYHDTEKYTDPEHFKKLLTVIGMNSTQVARLQRDSRTYMQILVSYYQSGGATDLEKYIQDLNKTFANAR